MSLPEVVVAVELWVPVVPELWELVVSVDPVEEVSVTVFFSCRRELLDE